MMRLQDIRMKPKLIGLFLLVGIIPMALGGWWAKQLSSDSLMKEAYSKLESVREIKKIQVERYFDERKGDMGVLVETVATLRREAFSKLEAIQETKKLHFMDYIKTLKNQLNISKDDSYIKEALLKLNQAYIDGGNSVKGAEWNALAKQYDPRLKDILDDNGWYDLFLINKDGDIKKDFKDKKT